MIKYIGSKRLLVEQIAGLIGLLPGVESVLDLFSGTARVGHALKQRGYRVSANDHTSYAHVLATCYVQADRTRWLGEAEARLAELAALPPRAGYFTQTFCRDSRYFQEHNGARIDAMRDRLQALALAPELEAILLTALMEAADRVDSTVGLQMAYLKSWAARASNQLALRTPALVAGVGTALKLDALECAALGEYDVVYLDPPYNQHKYMNNYHVWETLVRWDKPAVYGIACKRVDCREYDSPFNSKRRIREALATLVGRLRARYLIVSFNDEGYLSESELCELLAPRGDVQVLAVDFKRYVGAKIGIYNPSGQKIGKVSHLRNRELLFLVDCEKRGGVDIARIAAKPAEATPPVPSAP